MLGHLVKADVDHCGHLAVPLDGVVGQPHHERIPAPQKDILSIKLISLSMMASFSVGMVSPLAHKD